MNTKAFVAPLTLALVLASCAQTPQVAPAPAAVDSPRIGTLSHDPAYPITPHEINETIVPGSSKILAKTVKLPDVPPRLDLVLSVDLSGSYEDDIGLLKTGLAEAIFDGVRANVDSPFSRFALTSFIDFPQGGYGLPGDYPYLRNQDFTLDKTVFLNAVNAMTLGNGLDIPESQYEAFFRMAVGDPASRPSWDPVATKVIALTTDAPFHNSDVESAYPGAGKVATTNALVGENIKVIGLKAPGAQSELDDVAAATGGAVRATTANSSDIVNAILDALEDLKFNVTATPVGCGPLAITFDPPFPRIASSGEVIAFDETVAVPAGTDVSVDPDGVVNDCHVIFKADDTVIGQQDLTITMSTAPSMDVEWPASTVAATGLTTSVPFTVNATDAEDGDLSAAATCEVDGTAATSPASLTIGSHTVSCSVTDSYGLSATDTDTVLVNFASIGGFFKDGWNNGNKKVGSVWPMKVLPPTYADGSAATDLAAGLELYINGVLTPSTWQWQGQFYMDNLDTSGMTAGTYNVEVKYNGVLVAAETLTLKP